MLVAPISKMAVKYYIRLERPCLVPEALAHCLSGLELTGPACFMCTSPSLNQKISKPAEWNGMDCLIARRDVKLGSLQSPSGQSTVELREPCWDLRSKLIIDWCVLLMQTCWRTPVWALSFLLQQTTRMHRQLRHGVWALMSFWQAPACCPRCCTTLCPAISRWKFFVHAANTKKAQIWIVFNKACPEGMSSECILRQITSVLSSYWCLSCQCLSVVMGSRVGASDYCSTDTRVPKCETATSQPLLASWRHT